LLFLRLMQAKRSHEGPLGLSLSTRRGEDSSSVGGSPVDVVSIWDANVEVLFNRLRRKTGEILEGEGRKRKNKGLQ